MFQNKPVKLSNIKIFSNKTNLVNTSIDLDKNQVNFENISSN